MVCRESRDGLLFRLPPVVPRSADFPVLQQALGELMKNRTVLVIAHRLATVKHADRVVVVHDGRLAEVGTHDQLMTREDGIYRRLAQLQSLDALSTN